MILRCSAPKKQIELLFYKYRGTLSLNKVQSGVLFVIIYKIADNSDRD